MGLASGGGGGGGSSGGGGGAFVFINRSGKHEPSAGALMFALGMGAVLIGGVITYVFVSNNKTNNQIKMERKEFEARLAEDAGVKQFNLDYFDWLVENDEYFFTFSGSALKMDGQPIDFVLTKYNVSAKNYYELITFIEKHDIKGLDQFTGLFPRILDIVQESELVQNTVVDELSNAVYDKESGEMIALKNIKMPVINKEKQTASYLVQYIKFNKYKSKDASLEFITKNITVPLEKEMEELPSLAFFAPKEKAKVETLRRVEVPVSDFDYLHFDGQTKEPDLGMGF